jgi:hypothetical protein
VSIWSSARSEVAGILEGSRLSRQRRDKLMALVQELERIAAHHQHESRRAQVQARDLRIHLRDRDAHIANLEAQLRPHLLHATDDAEQMAIGA